MDIKVAAVVCHAKSGEVASLQVLLLPACSRDWGAVATGTGGEGRGWEWLITAGCGVGAGEGCWRGCAGYCSAGEKVGEWSGRVEYC